MLNVQDRIILHVCVLGEHKSQGNMGFAGSARTLLNRYLWPAEPPHSPAVWGNLQDTLSQR